MKKFVVSSKLSYTILVRFSVADPIKNLELCVTESDNVCAIFSRHKFKILPEILSKILRKISSCIRSISCKCLFDSNLIKVLMFHKNDIQCREES